MQAWKVKPEIHVAFNIEMDGNGCNGSLGWLKLNIGGQIFLTTKATLAKENNSFLARLSSEDPELSSDKVRF